MNRFLMFHLILFLVGSSLEIHQFVSATAVVSTVVGFTRGCGYSGDGSKSTKTSDDALTCFNISMNEPSVCSSHGVYKSIDNCECDNGWYSSNCSLTRCFGIANNNSTVWSSHGYCTSPDTCFCTDKYLGSTCNSNM